MTSMKRISSLKRISSTCDVKRLMNAPAAKGEQYVPTDVEHLANIFTHGIGVPPSALGTLFMIYLAKTKLQYFIALLYGFALMVLFSVSCTYHTICYKGIFRKLKETFHFGDRAVIYFFIASSYTPWLLLKDFGGFGEEVLCIVWTMAVCGTVYQYFFLEKCKSWTAMMTLKLKTFNNPIEGWNLFFAIFVDATLSIALVMYKCLEILFYVIIGVCPAAAIYIMKKPAGLYELSLGGITYVTGIIFFKLDGKIPFAHAIWHCFVLVGAMYHYYAICTYLLGHDEDESVIEY